MIVLVAKRVLGEPLNARDLWVAPVVLTGIGVWILIRTDGLDAADYGWLAGGGVAGFALGFLRGSFVVVFEKRGFLWQRYTARTFAVVAASVVVLAAFGLLAERLGLRAEARPVQLGLGISFLGEAVAVARRARRLGVPFAPQPARR
jgi:hypothetical protein